LIFGDRREVKQVTPSTRISVLKALIARTFGINVRKREIVFIEDEKEIEILEGDRSREVGWFIDGRKGKVIIR
jgi:hypothetical protein